MLRCPSIVPLRGQSFQLSEQESGKPIKLIRNPLLQKAAALCCVEGNEQKGACLWKQTSKGIPLVSNILLHFFFLLNSNFFFHKNAKATILGQIEGPSSSWSCLIPSNLKAILLLSPDYNHIFVIYCLQFCSWGFSS